MKVLGINGSPRNKGNSHYLMSLFMEEMKAKGYDTHVLDATKLTINPCIGCGSCEKKGVCIFTDDFSDIFLPQMNMADIVVISSPVYFYAFPALLKALIDRVQVMWARKYRLKTGDFTGRNRKGVLLAVGATHGKDLFDGLKMTAKYFFDAADVQYEKSLYYRGVDEKGGMEEKYPTVHDDMKNLLIDF